MSRRWKIVRVSQDILSHMLTTGIKPAVEVRGGLPPTAVLDGAFYNPVMGSFELRFRDDSFPEVAEFCAVPQLTPTCHKATESQVVTDAFDRGWDMGRASSAADAPAVVEGSP